MSCKMCNGARKFYQTASNGARRLMNCRMCGAKGSLPCSCSSGRIGCDSCDGRGSIIAWLEVNSEQREDVQVEPDRHVTRAFSWGADGIHADDAVVAADARFVCVVESDRPLSEEELPPAIPEDWKETHWKNIQPPLQPEERVVKQRLTLLEVPSADVTYQVMGRRTTVSFEGRRLLAPPASDDGVFARRARTMNIARASAIAIPIILLVAYFARGEWFRSLEVAAFIGAAALAAILAYLGVSKATLNRREGLPWFGGAVVAVAATALLGVHVEPSLERARAALVDGDREHAARELAAFGQDAHPSASALNAVLLLRRIQETTDANLALDILNQIPEHHPEHALGLAHIDALRLAAFDIALRAQRLDEAALWLNALSPTARTSPDGLSAAERLTAARDSQLLAKAQAALERGELREGQDAMDALTDSSRESDDARSIAAHLALARGDVAIRRRAWSDALDEARKAESFGLPAEASALRSRIDEAMQAEVDDLLAQSNVGELEPRIKASERAEHAIIHLAEVRGGPPPAQQVDALRKRRKVDVETLAKQLKARDAAERKAAAERQRKEERAQAERLRQEQRAEAARKREAQRAAAQYRSWSSGPRCVRGCPCGNACISCSKRCRR